MENDRTKSIFRQSLTPKTPSPGTEPDPPTGGGQASPPFPSPATEIAESLPCLYSNNSIQTYHKSTEQKVVSALARFLSPYHRRQAEALHLNVERLIASAPDLGHIGFFTLTTKDNISNHEEFQRRWNSFRTNYLSKSAHFGSWIGTYERQGAKAKHAWHIHLVVVVSQDIRTGCDFSEFEKRRYKTAPAYLRELWAELREKCEAYGFGRHELLPVKSTSEGLARYVGKYVSKHIGARQEEDKGKRLIVASRDWVRHSCNFAWNNEGGQEWRRKLQIFARLIGCNSINQLSARLGPGWAYRYADSIMDADDMLERCKGQNEPEKGQKYAQGA